MMGFIYFVAILEFFTSREFFTKKKSKKKTTETGAASKQPKVSKNKQVKNETYFQMKKKFVHSKWKSVMSWYDAL